MAKTDSTGQFAIVADGTSPASPVLADGYAVYTAGLSERRNGASLFRHDDLLGSLRFLTDSSQGVQANRLFSGFGATVVTSGAAWEPFGWAGAAGDQTDADTGLVLMGHRLYDSRLGRFLSQDPIGDGTNWYAYAGNDPINNTDPQGLFMSSGMSFSDIYDRASALGGPGSEWSTTDSSGKEINHFFVSNFNFGVGTPGAGMFAQGQHVDNQHSALDHYRGKTGTPMSVGIKELPKPNYWKSGPKLSDSSQIKALIRKEVNGSHAVNINGIALNFNDNLIGRSIGHFEGTLSIDNGSYSLDGKLFSHPDFYDFNSDSTRGVIGQIKTWVGGTIAPGGVGFPVNVGGYLPIHETGSIP